MKVLGITGSVGAGKSYLLNYIRKNYSSRIVMADTMAHELMEPGGICYGALIEHFGEEIVSGDGTINRPMLARIIFGDEKERQFVNSLAHPAVKKEIMHQICIEKEKNEIEVFVIEAALLLEDGYDTICEEIWYIATDAEVRSKRLKESRNYSDEKIKEINESQASEEFFLTHCQRVIDNNTTPENACRQLDDFLKDFLEGKKEQTRGGIPC